MGFPISRKKSEIFFKKSKKAVAKLYTCVI